MECTTARMNRLPGAKALNILCASPRRSSAGRSRTGSSANNLLSKRLAVIQSSYIPWKGYFDLIASVDEFVLYDDVQYTVRDWRNRNRVKTRHGVKWLTVPVLQGARDREIREVVVSERGWAELHWRTLAHSYAGARHFDDIRKVMEPLYLGCQETQLSAINAKFLRACCDLLCISTPIRWSWEYPVSGTRAARLLDLCRKAGATTYVSGPSGRAYIEPEMFHREGIAVEFFDYSGYPEYNQLFPPFDHHVSIVDLLFNEGPDARRFMKVR
jgi:hypothetical protein